MKKFFAILIILFSVAMTVNAQMLTTTLPKGTTYVNIATDSHSLPQHNVIGRLIPRRITTQHRQ